MKTTSEIIKTITHRERDSQGRRLGHHAYIKRRSDAEMAKFGGKRFASFARKTRDGVASGPAEKFETYDTRREAVAHALYAAGKLYRHAQCGCVLDDVDIVLDACDKPHHHVGQFYVRQRRTNFAVAA